MNSSCPARQVRVFVLRLKIVILLFLIAPSPDAILMFPNTVTGAPVVGSPSTSSPLVTLKHGSNLVTPKQEIIQKKEEEVETRNSPKKRVHIIPAQDYEYLNRNVFPTSIKPQDLGSNQDEELEIWCKVKLPTPKNS